MEIFTLILISTLAIISGTITGLIPGLHINFISILILINYKTLTTITTTENFIIFIIIMSLTHTFIDFIPSIIFGIPDPNTVLSILPGQKLLLKGQGYKAIFYSALGSQLGVITSIFIAIIFYFSLNTIQTQIRPLIPYILSIILLLGILLEPTKNQKFWAIFLILITGGYGTIILNSKFLTQPLLIIFTSIFGTANIINSLLSKTTKIPPQTYKLNQTFKQIFNKNFIKSQINGSISSSLCSITPGIGNIQAATISSILTKKTKFKKNSRTSTNHCVRMKTNSKSSGFLMEKENFISQLSLINTNNFILSLITFLTIQKTRNGSIFVISQILQTITLHQIIKYFLLITIISPIIFYLTLKIGKYSIKKLTKLNFKKINLTILIFLTLLITHLEGIYGLLTLITGTLLGIITINRKIKRIHLMSALIIPIILNLL